jgi:hypothetical protein
VAQILISKKAIALAPATLVKEAENASLLRNSTTKLANASAQKTLFLTQTALDLENFGMISIALAFASLNPHTVNHRVNSSLWIPIVALAFALKLCSVQLMPERQFVKTHQTRPPSTRIRVLANASSHKLIAQVFRHSSIRVYVNAFALLRLVPVV